MNSLPGSVRRLLKLSGLAVFLVVTPVLCLLAACGLREPAMRWWCHLLGFILWVRMSCRGPKPPPGSLLVANHLGYLDPIVLGRFLPARFLAKSEIAGWPLVGILTRLSGALFVERERPRSAAGVVEAVAKRLLAGDRILLFPEAGVSADGATLGAFRPMLFEACVSSGRPVVPAAIRYEAPADRRAWAWYDHSTLWNHLWHRLLPAPGIRAELLVGRALAAVEGEGRKELAARTRDAVRELMEGGAE